MAINTEDIQKSITENVDTITGTIKRHMEDQPYLITCQRCGEDLECVCTVDYSDCDLHIEVEPHVCREL